MPVRTDVAGGVYALTLDSPDNRNALNAGMVRDLLDGIRAAADDPDARAVVLTNTGRVFCAGADLSETAARQTSEGSGVRFDAVLRGIQTLRLPVIARIDGHVVGGGVGLAAACDISVARDDARFGFTEVRLGVVPAIISVVCLPKMRRGDAMEAFLRGDRWPATRAAELGLINHAVPPEKLDETVWGILTNVLAGGPNALAMAKRLVNEIPTMSDDDAYAWATELSGSLFRSDEASEGMAAFLDKRPPPWAPGA